MYYSILRIIIILSIFLLIISCASSPKSGLSKPLNKGWAKNSLEIQNNLKNVKFVRLFLRNEDETNTTNTYFEEYLNKVFKYRLKNHGFIVTTKDENESITILIGYDYKKLCAKYSSYVGGPGFKECPGGDLTGNITIHYKDTLIYENTYRGYFFPWSFDRGTYSFAVTFELSGINKVISSLVYYVFLGKNTIRPADESFIVIDRDNQFYSFDNGLIFDLETGVLWPVKGNGTDIGFLDAKDYAENFTFAGHKNWRLPKKEEIESILNVNYKSRPENQKGYSNVNKYIEVSECCIWMDTRQYYINRNYYNYYDFCLGDDFSVRSHEIQKGNYWIDTRYTNSVKTTTTKRGRVLPVAYLSIED